MEEFTPRLYQQKILDTVVNNNTLVVLPTGLGKTAIAGMLAKKRLESYTGSKILILAPTKPLCQQHEETMNQFFPNSKISLFTGSVSPEKREKLWHESQIIISTPQGLENDIIRRKISLKDTSLVVFDEAHRATGSYAYVYIADKYMEDASHSRILALTASPGTDTETITEVCNNLHVEEIEYRSKEDEDVKPYVQDLESKYIEVELPEEMKRVRMFLQKSYDSKLVEAHKLGYLSGDYKDYNKSQLLKLLSSLHGKMVQGEKEFEILKTVSLLAEALKLQHALELVETQGVHSLLEYMNQLAKEAESSKVKAVKNVVKDINYRSAMILAQNLQRKDVKHPKLEKTKELVKQEVEENENSKIIIFSQYRDTGGELKEQLKEENITSELFVGQAKKKNTGMSQKKQKEMIQRFEANEFNCLIATSVGEEGLDIPEVNLVVFYEPIPSAIRTVQRRGRTGRQHKGKVYTLVTKGTRDEAYRWSAHHKEKRMYRQLEGIKKKLNPNQRQEKLVTEEDILIKADFREKGSPLVKELLSQNVKLDLENLPVGDFQLSDDTIVEFKNIPDFVDSILDKRLLSQARDLKQYKKPMILLQGEEDIYSQRRIHPNAVRGMIAALTINYGIPIIRTKNPKDSVDFLKVIAKREQLETKDYQQHSQKPFTDKQLQEYIVSSLPGIGTSLAKPLLDKFGSIKKIVNASEEELKRVELIGDKKGKQLKELFEKEYSDE